jgi:phosphate transport system protein
MREQFANELDELYSDVGEIMGLVIVAFRNSVRSLLSGDVGLANEVVDGDDVIDSACIGIEERALEVIATQSPVARDLRLLISLTYIVWHLERMADLSVNIARAARRTQGMRGAQTLCDLIQAQGNLVHRVLETTVEAFERKDLELALKLPELDEPIDQLYKQFFRELARLTDEEEIEWASSMVLASRYLERISDNAVDIGERIAYMVTGDREQTAIDSTHL